MEDYGYTFEDLANMTTRQRAFLFHSKLARMEKEAEKMKEIEAEVAKTKGKTSKASMNIPRAP